jgi:hypothetical protein
MWKVFKCLWKKRGKYLAVFGEYAESIEAYMKKTMKLGLFAVHSIVPEYAESI